MSSPTQLSLKELRKRGYQATVVEKFIPYRKIRKDAFGGDILYCGRGTHQPVNPETGLIQACAASSLRARERKCRDNPEVWGWIRAGNRFKVWAWGKQGARGKRKLWTLREVEITDEA